MRRQLSRNEDYSCFEIWHGGSVAYFRHQKKLTIVFMCPLGCLGYFFLELLEQTNKLEVTARSVVMKNIIIDMCWGLGCWL
jgi:S-ribosylhomocysteine lyase LuxS involved in autoinducer biosynthesis